MCASVVKCIVNVESAVFWQVKYSVAEKKNG